MKFKIRLIFLLLFILSINLNAQINKNRYALWYIPSINTRINGIAGGIVINSFKEGDLKLTTLINGISIELIGAGFFVPLAPSSPIYFEPDSFYYKKENIDSIVNSYSYAKYRINGISLAGGGIGGHDINVNGLNISGLNTLTGKMNGISACIMFNISGVVNGVSFGGIGNNSIQTKGLQIGLFNKTTRLRGIQIGLWNQNEKRDFPLLNWNFSE